MPRITTTPQFLNRFDFAPEDISEIRFGCSFIEITLGDGRTGRCAFGRYYEWRGSGGIFRSHGTYREPIRRRSTPTIVRVDPHNQIPTERIG